MNRASVLWTILNVVPNIIPLILQIQKWKWHINDSYNLLKWYKLVLEYPQNLRKVGFLWHYKAAHSSACRKSPVVLIGLGSYCQFEASATFKPTVRAAVIFSPTPASELHRASTCSWLTLLPHTPPCLLQLFQRMRRAWLAFEVDSLATPVVKLLWLLEWGKGGDRRRLSLFPTSFHTLAPQ